MTLKIHFIFYMSCLICFSAIADAAQNISINFKLHDITGNVAVTIEPNNDPARWGFETLGTPAVNMAAIKGFPVCTAKTKYSGVGYKSEMGWLQFITIYRHGERPTVELDHSPQMVGTNVPYISWGPLPSFFDAPSMLNVKGEKVADVEWRADTFLVGSSDSVMTKTIIPVASFSWGYKIDAAGKAEITTPKMNSLSRWRDFSKQLKEEFKDWNFPEQ